jgi:ParB family chromosome partitioning protein
VARGGGVSDEVSENAPRTAAGLETGGRGRRPSLGRGLAALFGESGAHLPSEPGGARPSAVRLVPIEAIRPSPFQPRRHFAEEELEGLAQSIRGKGIVQPLLVRLVEDTGTDGDTSGEGEGAEAEYELVAGERRWRAAQLVGLHEVPILVRGFSDSEVIEIALIENLQRADLSALEEAEAYSRLMREFGRSQASLADSVGKSRSHVANTVRLLSLPDPVRKCLEEGALSAGHARALLGAADPAALAEEVVRRGLNVRATENLVRRGLAQPAPRPKPSRDADTLALERDLSAALGLRVTLALKSRGGSLTLHYASLNQLDRILALLRRP